MFKKVISIIMAAVIFCGLFAAMPLGASAAAIGNDYPLSSSDGRTGGTWGRNYPKDNTQDKWGMYNRECVSFCANRLAKVNGITVGWGVEAWSWHAYQWDDHARSMGKTVNNTPAIGAIAVDDTNNSKGKNGHVSWVADISADGSQVFLEWYNTNGDGLYHYGWSATNSHDAYCHFKDIGTTTPLPLAPSGYTNVSHEYMNYNIFIRQISINKFLTTKPYRLGTLSGLPWLFQRGTGNYAPLYADSDEKSGFELFSVGQTTDGWLTFWAQSNKKYVVADKWANNNAPVAAARTSVGSGECFMICKKGNDLYIYSQATQKFVTSIVCTDDGIPVYAIGNGSSNDRMEIIKTSKISGGAGGGYGSISLPAKIPVPPTPASASISSANQCIGATANATWSSSDYASSYLVSLICTTNSAYSQPAKEMGGTGTYYVLNNPGTYKISVKAKNSSGESGARESGTITIHPNKTVTFKDWDGKTLLSQSVPYNGVACAPLAPSRTGYTFQGWDKGFNNITTDQTIMATYKINRHTVKFLNNRGETLKTQTVDYGSAATPPVVESPDGYSFIDWDSKNYLNVTEDLTITGVYVWTNPDLPNIVKIQSAARNQEASGYNVTVSLQNAPLGLVRGRVIVALKTTTGKMVASATETYYLRDLAEAARTVYVPYSGVAKIAEVSIVGLLDDENTGVPLAKTATADINLGLTFSDWGISLPEIGDYVTESRIDSRYRDKLTTTRNSPSLDGWTLIKTEKTGWGSWSGWGTTPYGSSPDREVQTQVVPATYKTQWHYYRWTNGSSTYSYQKASNYWYEETWFDYELPLYKNGSSGTAVMCNGEQIAKNIWIKATFPDAGNKTNRVWTRQVQTGGGYTQWRYRDAVYTYTFEKWNDWSSWQPGTVPTASGTKQVETRTMYRYKADESKLIENTEGVERTVSGTIGTPGKLVTLLVFRETNVDPTASQLEYIAQTTIDANGNYSFTYTTKEEPNEKTGDFIVMVAPEGGTSPIYVETIKAPLPKYIVVFQDDDGTEISRQTVISGESAILPENPNKDGYDFIGWDQSTVNISKDMNISATYEKKKYQILFEDWDGESLLYNEFEYGDVPYLEEAPQREGHTFVGWVTSNGNDVDTSTGSMTVTAKYTANTYNVQFLDWDGELLSEQQVVYGEPATPPAIGAPPEANKVFLEWTNSYELEHITEDTVAMPVSAYEETVEEPAFSVVPGAYENGQAVRLTCATPGAKIFFTMDGTIPAYEVTQDRMVTNGMQYYSPVSVEEDTVLIAAAFAPEKNDSPLAVGIYYIGGDVVDVSGIALNKTAVTLNPGQSVKLTATVTPQNATDQNVTWSTSDASVATVSAGSVTAKKVGTATITAKAGNKTVSCKITVSEPKISVTGVKITGNPVNAVQGQKFTLKASVSPANATDKTVTWSSNATNVATVNAKTGEVTAKDSGIVTITAKSSNGKVATCKITVHRYVSLRIGYTKAIQNGVKGNIDNLGTKPLIISGKTMLPLRFVSEKMGAKVTYVNDKTPIKIVLGKITVTFTLGEKVMYVNNDGEKSTIKLDVPAQIKNGKTYIPLRAIGQALGFDIYYDSKTEIIVVNNPKMTSAIKTARLNEAKGYIK